MRGGTRRRARSRAAKTGSRAPSRTPPTSSASIISSRLDEETVVAEQLRAVEESVEPPTRWFAEVETRHAGASAATASWVESAARFTLNEIGEKAVQRGFKDSLQSAEDEVTAGCRVDDESEVVWEEVLRESIAFNTSERGEAPDGAMSVRVHERE